MSGAAAGDAPDTEVLHREVAARLAGLDQRYTAKRRSLVDALVRANRPVTIGEIVGAGAGAGAGLPVSTAYRNLTVLCEAGVARRLVGADDFGRFELSEELSGHHHHHLTCTECGTVTDVRASSRFEAALAEAARLAAGDTGYEVTDHRIELVGRCPGCRRR